VFLQNNIRQKIPATFKLTTMSLKNRYTLDCKFVIYSMLFVIIG